HTGFRFYVISMVITVGLIANHPVVHLYHKLPNFVAILCLFGIVFCALLYVKVLLCWKANYETLPPGTINYPLTATTLLQTIYLAKCYYLEDGYMNVS
ncbi:unnamed protein product, partial [Oppiella nova]